MDYEFLIPCVLTLLLAVWNIMQQRKLQELKRMGDKQLHIHTLQFDKEFEIYSEIWIELVKLRNSIRKPGLQPGTHGSKLTGDEVLQERLEKTIEIGNSLIEKVEHNKPFYAAKVYNSLHEVINLLNDEITRLGEMPGREYWKEGEATIYKLLSATETVCETIRERIGLLEK